MKSDLKNMIFIQNKEMEIETNNRYSNGKVYKLWRLDYDDIYVGSTCLDLCKRLYDHKKNYKLWKEGKTSFVTAYKLFEMSDNLSDVKIELIEYFPCNTKADLEKREGEYIRNTECLNKVVPGRSSKEYYQNNKTILCEKKREYYDANKEILLEKMKTYRELNKAELARKDKDFYEANKDTVLEKMKQYYQPKSQQNSSSIRSLFIT